MLTVDLELKRDDFCLQVREEFALDGVTGVMGPSGCGKTTLLRCIAGLEKRATGSVNFKGQCWQKQGWQKQGWQKGKAFLPSEKREIGYIFQDGRLFPHLNVLGNLRYGQKRAGKGRESGPDFDDVIDWLHIRELLERPVCSLSGGQRQRVAIGRALLSAPRLLLMDEPMAALDWAARAAIMPQLRNINRHFGVPVLFVSHDREEMARLADELVLMEGGCIQERGNARRLLNRAEGALADDRALSVLEGKVVRKAPYGVSELDVDGRLLVVDQEDLAEGDVVRVVIPAAEVSLSLDEEDRISIQNRLPATLTDVCDIDGHHALVGLTLEEQQLLALVTRRSRHRLGLKPGMSVYAHFKAACLEVV